KRLNCVLSVVTRQHAMDAKKANVMEKTMRNRPTTRLVMGALLVFVVAAFGSYWIGSMESSASTALTQIHATGGTPATQVAPGQQVGMPRFIVTDIQTRPSSPKPRPKR
ncbi:MAG: hypothetical protein WC655_12650, partial [Candidatus Hydrogenedentales bacterium]